MIISLTSLKTLWKQEKMLVTSIFSFFHDVFEMLLIRGCGNSGSRGKGLNSLPKMPRFNLQEKKKVFKNVLTKRKKKKTNPYHFF